MRRLVIISILVAVALPLSATEPNPSAKQKELAEKLIVAMRVDRIESSFLDAIYSEIERQFVQDAEAKGNDPDDIAEAKELFKAFRERTSTIDFSGLLREEQARIYAKYFNEQELADLCAFYAGSTGKKMIEVTPQLMAEGAKAGVDKVGPKMQQVIAQVLEEHEQKRPWRRTTADMRALASAVEAYQ